MNHAQADFMTHCCNSSNC